MTATPQDHKKATYTFEHDGKKFVIPAISSLPVGVTRKARKAKDDVDQVFILLEAALGEDSKELAAIDSMDAKQFDAFLTGWTDGASVGEASGSES